MVKILLTWLVCYVVTKFTAFNRRTIKVKMGKVCAFFVGNIFAALIFREAKSTNINAVSWPVTLGGSTFVLCTPLQREIHRVREAAWFIYNRKHDNWTYILGVERISEQSDSWQYKTASAVNCSKYKLSDAHIMFLKIDNVTVKDNGAELRCSIFTWDGHTDSIHIILTLTPPPPEDLKASSTTACTAPASATMHATGSSTTAPAKITTTKQPTASSTTACTAPASPTMHATASSTTACTAPASPTMHATGSSTTAPAKITTTKQPTGNKANSFWWKFSTIVLAVILSVVLVLQLYLYRKHVITAVHALHACGRRQEMNQFIATDDHSSSHVNVGERPNTERNNPTGTESTTEEFQVTPFKTIPSDECPFWHDTNNEDQSCSLQANSCQIIICAAV